MSHLLRILSDWFGPAGSGEYVIGLVASLISIGGAFIYFRPMVSKWLRVKIIGPWRVAQLDEVAKEFLEGERRYLIQFIESMRVKRWDPQGYVRPSLQVKEQVTEPINPILHILERAILQEAPRNLTLSERRERLETKRVSDLLREVKRLKRVVVLGDPGAGKTICLIQLGLELASNSLISTNINPIIPIFISLNEYTSVTPTGEPTPVLEFVKEQIRNQTLDTDAFHIYHRFDTLMRDGRILFLFDALDEMPRDDYYRRFKALSRFLNSHRKNMFVFSCRLLDYIDDPTFSVHHAILSPFSNSQIRELFRRYLGKAGRSAWQNVISDKNQVSSQVRSPFFLSLISKCVKAKLPVGASWDVLIGNWVDVVLDEERERRGVGRREWDRTSRTTIDWLSTLAFELVSSRATGTKADNEMVRATLSTLGMNHLPLEVAKACGIIRDVGLSGAVRFEHHRLQEYFAALSLSKRFDSDRIELSTFLNDIWWREVVVMASGLTNQPDLLIRGILDEADRAKADGLADTSYKYKHEMSLSEIRYEFNHIMLAMSCFPSARHKLSKLTRDILVDCLVQFLRYGNMLMKVRAIRIAAQFEDPTVLSEIKLLLRDPSQWVRETALSTLADSSISSPSLAKTVWHQMFTMTRGEELLIRGLHEFPVLMKHRRTIWFVPIYFSIAAFAAVKAIIVWLVACFAIYWEWRRGVFSARQAVYFALFMPSTYLLISRLIRKGFNVKTTILNLWNIDSFNRWCFYSILVYFAFDVVISIGNIAAGKIPSFGGVLVGLVYEGLLILILYFNFKMFLKLYLEYKRRKDNRGDIDIIVPDLSIHGRNRQALKLLASASKDPDPIVRKKLIDSIRHLIPLGSQVLYELEEFSGQESNIDVRTKVWQVYEQVELAIEREGDGRGMNMSQ